MVYSLIRDERWHLERRSLDIYGRLCKFAENKYPISTVLYLNLL